MSEYPPSTVTGSHRQAAQLIWDYHQMRHSMRQCDAAIGFGSPGTDVAGYSAELYHVGWFPVMVVTGPGYLRQHAVGHGVPESAILAGPRATNTALTITLSRAALDTAGVQPHAVMLVAMPHLQRRAYATCRKLWPEVTVVCASPPVSFEQYVTTIGDERHVIEMLVGDLQRVIEYPWRGYAIAQEVPPDVHAAYRDLLNDGYTRRLLTPATGFAHA